MLECLGFLIHLIIMEIKFYGHACFSIEDKGATVLMDPFTEEIGLKFPQVKADVVSVSQNLPAHNNTKSVAGEPRVFSWPGEYETKGVHFRLIHSLNPEEKENNITIAHFNGIKLCHLGNQAKKLTSEQLEQVGEVDILFVPVGDNTSLGPKKAKEVIEQIEPRVIIPMIYATEGIKLELGPIAGFLSEMGATSSESVDMFKFKKSELPEDNSKIVVMNITA